MAGGELCQDRAETRVRLHRFPLVKPGAKLVAIGLVRFSEVVDLNACGRLVNMCTRAKQRDAHPVYEQASQLASGLWIGTDVLQFLSNSSLQIFQAQRYSKLTACKPRLAL